MAIALASPLLAGAQKRSLPGQQFAILWSTRGKAFSSKASGGLLEPVMVQKATQCLLGLQLDRQRRFGGIVEIQRNHVAKALMRPARVVMFFNRGQDPAQVGLP